MPIVTGPQMKTWTDWLTDIKAAFELLWTFTNLSWAFLNLSELCSKCFELHNYAAMPGVEKIL